MADIDVAKPPANATKPEAPLTVISETDSVSGRLEMKGDGQVMGRFSGEIECAGELLVGREARVEARISTRNLTISGHVKGNLTATGRLKITATGRLEGDARVGALVVQEGGVHLGSIEVHPEGVPQLAEPASALPAPPSSADETEPQEAGASRPRAASVERVKKMWGEFF